MHNLRRLSISVLSISLILFSSCSQRVLSNKEIPNVVYYPPSPDTARIQYLTSISSSADVTDRPSALKRFVFGEEIPITIIKPYGVTVNIPKIYICDGGIGGLVNIDLSEKSFEYFIPTGRGRLQLPINCEVDDEGLLYVADANRRQIVVFDSEGNYLAEFGENTESFRPTDICVRNEKIFVASVKDQKVFVYEKSKLEILYSFPETEPGDPGYLYQPANISAEGDLVYVSDMGDNKVKVFSSDGRFIRSVGGYGSFAGQLMRPKGIVVDSLSNLYVVDAAFENVQIFNSLGNVLMFFGGQYKTHGDMWLPADVTISYTGLEYFNRFVDPRFSLKYLIFVTNMYGPDKVNVYGFLEPVK